MNLEESNEYDEIELEVKKTNIPFLEDKVYEQLLTTQSFCIAMKKFLCKINFLFQNSIFPFFFFIKICLL